MRIDRLDFLAFGPFTGKQLALDQGHHGLHLIFGPNEAGKSSALRGLRDALYGIPSRSLDNFIHRHQDLRIGFELRTQSGERISAVRRKGNTKTLLDPKTDEPMAETKLERLLSNVPRDLFESMFGIDYQTLVRGGDEIVRFQGRVGETLFTAAGGLNQLRQVRQTLDDRAEDLFKSGGSKPKLNALIREWSEAVKQGKSLRLASREYEVRRKDHDAAQAKLAQIDAEWKQTKLELERLERLDRALPLLAKRRQHQEQLKQYSDTRTLRDDFEAEFRAARKQLDLASHALSREQAAMIPVEKERQSVQLPTGVVEHRDEIRALVEALGGHRKAQHDLPGLQAKYADGRKTAAVILKELRSDLTLDEVDQLRLSPRERDRLTKLGKQHERIRLDQERCATAIDTLRERLREAESELANLGVANEADSLAAVVQSILAFGNIEQQASELSRKAARGFDAARLTLQQLGRWQGDLLALESTVLPSVATIASHERAIAEAEARVEEISREIRRQEERLSAISLDLATLQGADGDLPTEENVRQSRATRDQAWKAARAAWFAGEISQAMISPEVERELKHGSGSTDAAREANSSSAWTPEQLAQTYERLVTQADSTVDLVRREQRRIADQARLVREQTQIREEQTRAEQRLADAHRRVAGARQAWLDTWTPLGINAASPAEMRDWRNEMEQLRKPLPELRSLEREASDLREQIDAARRRLATAWQAVGQSGWEDDESLGQAMRRVQRWLDEQRELANRRTSLLAKVSELRRECESQERQQQKLADETTAWKTAWSTAIDPLGLDNDASPDQVSNFLQRCDDLHEVLRETDGPNGLLTRIRGIESDAAAFAQEVDRIAGACGISGSEATDKAQQLLAALNLAETQEKLQAQLNRQHATALKQIKQLTEEVERQSVHLRGLCEEAGAASAELLDECWRRSREKADCKRQLEDVENELLRLASGQTIEELAVEASHVAPGAIATSLAELRDQLEQLDSQRGAQREGLGRIRGELEKMDGGTQAVEVNAHIQSLLGRIDEQATEYARWRIASFVLQKAIDRFGEKNKNPMLRRAGEYFARLTEGSFSELRVEYDDQGEPVLVGYRPAGKSIPVAGMSEGTADQLYFALRLAYLADWLDRHEPLPLVVDDILIKFDDQRALASLEVLAQFSQRTQVILFTHHQHLVELARTRLPSDQLFTHQL
ncbi:MAG: AAA family ATPase [Pirellulales bacterium]